MKPRRFVVLDRDGTVTVERGHLTNPYDLELLPNAAAGLRAFAELDLGLVIVTNQSVVGRGLIDGARLDEIHEKLRLLLREERVVLDGIYACPHRPDDGCDCRKPKRGLLERAARDLAFDPRACFVVGDKPCDIDLGRSVGATTFLVRTGYGAEHAASDSIGANHVVDDLAEAARVVKQILDGEREHLMPRSERYADRVRAELRESAEVKQRTADVCAESIVAAATAIAAAFRGGHKVLLCGNGGSAADCQHVAAEFMGRIQRGVDRPPRAVIALTTDTSFLTAHANDCGFEGVFDRQVEGLGRPGDVLVAISTSGNSPNVLRAVQKAHGIGMKTIGLSGEGGDLASLVDIAIVVPSKKCQRIQESHLAAEHALCDLVDWQLNGGGDVK